MIRHCDESNLWKEVFILAYSSRGDTVHYGKEGTGVGRCRCGEAQVWEGSGVGRCRSSYPRPKKEEGRGEGVARMLEQ